MPEEDKPKSWQKFLTDLGGSRAVIVPARLVRQHQWTEHTELELIATEDGFIVRTKVY